MPAITEGELTFAFADGWLAEKYDEWSHYRNQFNSVCGGTKAIDMLAIEPQGCCWLLEVKDYRRHRRTKTINLAEEVARKVRDTLAGLVSAQFHANDAGEMAAARRALRSKGIRVVLHLEQPTKPSRLFPRAIDPADIRQRLRQLIKAIDPHPLVVETTRMGRIPWEVT